MGFSVKGGVVGVEPRGDSPNMALRFLDVRFGRGSRESRSGSLSSSVTGALALEGPLT